jgi:uncharacterized protein
VDDPGAAAGASARRRRALALGLLAGAMSGLFGVGGGLVLVPGLVLVAGFAQHRAHATSLAAIVLTAPAALVPFALAGEVSWPAAAALAAGGVAGAVAGADVMRRLPARVLQAVFGALAVAVAVRLLLPGEAAAGAAGAAGAAAGGGPGAEQLAWLVAAGTASGLLSGLLGVGGGVVVVPLLVLGLGFDQHLAEGTSLAVIVPTALVGARRHARRGYTDWPTGLVVGAGGVAGGLAGGVLAQVVDGEALQAAFALLLAATGAQLLLRRRSPRPADPPAAPL